LWVAGIVGVSALLVGGIAYAATRGSGSTSCPAGTSWQLVSDQTTANTLLGALGYAVGSTGPGPGVYYGNYQGQPFAYVNNMDGSQSNFSSSVPSGSTGFFTCG